MVFGARNPLPVDAPHGQERGQSQSDGDEHLEELRVLVDGDHATKPRLGVLGQGPTRSHSGGQRGEDGPGSGYGRFLNPPRCQNERQGHADQNQFRDQQGQVS